MQLPATDDHSPPTRASLKAWWKQFNLMQRPGSKRPNDDKGEPVSVVFGVPLKDSLRYASVQISTANSDGQMYVWGYIPVVVAKCGLYLKEKATETEGVFRVNGSNKRMKELQSIFETPPRYGKSLDWKKETFTVHDVASVFRRYLTMMPEPVVPTNLYHEFREIYRSKTKADDIITEYKRIIRSMPRANQYLLLYVLDLLSVFARKSAKNLMPASNLAVIFRPGILAHPDHDLMPSQAELSQHVLEFLIDHQDWFMLDIPPPPPPSQVTTPAVEEPPSGSGEDNENDVALVPSSEDDHNGNGNHPLTGIGGWKLITRRSKSKRGRQDKRQSTDGKMTRSKSSIDRSRTHERLQQDRPSGELSPVNEGMGEDVVLAVGTTSVGRSRTLPSTHRKMGTGTSTEEEGTSTKEQGTTPTKHEKNVLKKPRKSRPVSTSAPSATSIGSHQQKAVDMS